MLCGAPAWCYLEKGNTVPHPPKNPPADRLLNWTGQFDVQGRTQTGHMEQGCVSSFTQSITVTAGCNQEGSVAFPEAAHGILSIALDAGSAGALSLVLGLGTPVTWLHGVCPALNLKADLLLQDGL